MVNNHPISLNFLRTRTVRKKQLLRDIVLHGQTPELVTTAQTYSSTQYSYTALL